ncbi:hypothetical protein EDB85DRAFT_2240501 [Lactarius pseudohatsudake]|nr:hypothetical protein EDB85DRAFT_2240501 [Lactarius pseudohatsudake]
MHGRGDARKPGAGHSAAVTGGWARSPSCTPRHARGGRGGVRGAGLASPALKGPRWARRPFCVTRRARARRVREAGVAWPGRRELGAGATRRGRVGWCALMWPPSAQMRNGGAGERAATAYLVRTPSDGKGGTGGGVPSCAPFPREWGGADRGEEGGGRRERYALVRPPFRANGEAPYAPYLRANGAAAVNAGEGRGVGVRLTMDGGGIGGMVQQFWTLRRKQNVPATIGCAKSVGRPPLPPLLPLPSPTPSASKRGRKRAGRRPSPPCIERGAQGGHTMIRGVRRLPVRAEGGAHEGVPLPSPPALLSPVRAAPFTRKGGARGYAAPGPSLPIGRGAHKVRRRRPLPGPSVPHLRGRGPHEGTPPHPTSPRRPRPQFPPSGPRHPGLPHAPRPRTPGDAEGPARPPRSLQRGRRQPSPAHTASPSPCMPGGAGGTTRPPLAPGFTRGTVRPPRSPPRYAQPRVCAHRPARAFPGA